MTDGEEPSSGTDPWAAWDAERPARHAAAARATRFAFYARVSTEDNQDPETSRQWQRRAAENLLRLSVPDAEIVSEFFDVGQSRSLPWSRRREASRLLAELDQHGRSWNAVVVGEGQRCFYGSQFTDTAPIFEDRGVALYVPELGGPYDPTNPSHYTLMSVTGGLSRGERQRIQERVGLSMGARSPSKAVTRAEGRRTDMSRLPSPTIQIPIRRPKG